MSNHIEAIAVLKKRFDELIGKENKIQSEITILMQEKDEILDLLRSLENSIKVLGNDENEVSSNNS